MAAPTRARTAASNRPPSAPGPNGLSAISMSITARSSAPVLSPTAAPAPFASEARRQARPSTPGLAARTQARAAGRSASTGPSTPSVRWQPRAPATGSPGTARWNALRAPISRWASSRLRAPSASEPRAWEVRRANPRSRSWYRYRPAVGESSIAASTSDSSNTSALAGGRSSSAAAASRPRSGLSAQAANRNAWA